MHTLYYYGIHENMPRHPAMFICLEIQILVPRLKNQDPRGREGRHTAGTLDASGVAILPETAGELAPAASEAHLSGTS